MSRQTDLRDDYSEEGLPVADDYSPESLGTLETRTGDPEQVWEEYGIELVPVEYSSLTSDGWGDTGRRIVQRNGQFISDVSDDYRLLPNEHLVGVANEVARDLGAGPFHEFDGDWFVELDDHVFQDQDRRRVHAVYAWDTGEIGGDEMEYGFGVHNSIDGSLGFSVGLFTFRHACANMVFMGSGSYMEQQALAVEEEREVISRHQQKHTASLSVEEDALKATIKGTLTLLDDVDATYEQWVAETVTPEDVRDLIKRPQLAGSDLPEWMQDIPEVLEEVHEDEYEEEEPMPWDHQAELIQAEIPEATSVWETYNDITEAIWHDGAANDNTRRSKMKDVHSVFQPAEHGNSEVYLR